MVLRTVKQWSVLALIASTSWAGIAAAAEQNAKPNFASVRKFTSKDGIAHHAVLLKSRDGLGDVAHNHIILIDTSASQVGEHRLHALEVLEGLLANLPATDRVRLLAVDVAPESLTNELVAPNSAAVQSALTELKARVPLGVTNLVGSVNAVRNMLPADAPGSIIYIGDGLSTADLVNSQELQGLVDQLRRDRVAVHSYGVGPQLNLHLLGIFAHQTGGMVQFDAGGARRRTKKPLPELGQALAQAVQQPVYRPEQLDVPADVALIPNLALPLRADRETIYLTNSILPADMTVTVRGGDHELAARLAAPTEGPENAFLAALDQRVAREGALANSLAGAALLDVAENEFQGKVAGLVNYGKLAFQKRDADRVQQAVNAVRELDPANHELAQLEKSARKWKAKSVAFRQETEEPADDSPEPEGTEPGDAGPEPMMDEASEGDLDDRIPPNPNSSLLDEQQRATKIRTQKLRQQVSDVINIVRRVDDPQVGMDELNRMLSTVRSALDIEPEVRQQLIKQLGSEQLSQTNRADIQTRQRIRIQEDRATKESQERLTERLALEEERLANLIDRVRALMEEGRHGDDDGYVEAEAVARVSVDVRPGDGTTAAALFGAEAAQQLNRSFRLRTKRADLFLETLHQVELSHVPFPDEPPIRFPPAAVWQALTERRRKWANVDLRKDSPNEVRIQTALDEQTEVSFVDTSLRDALDYIEDLHNFDILIMEAEITGDGGSIDQPVNLELSGVKLRSALKLMLQPLELDYVIADEVMQITTVAKAQERMSVRVYPVADLVIPVRSQAGGGMGMQGGMMMGGMGGGGMGGMGGGMGGMGGGMGGMGGMGGGGFFSIPVEAAPAPVAPVKKK